MNQANDLLERPVAVEHGARSGVDYNLIDSDAHMTEPGELWQRVDKEFRDRAPKMLSEHKGRRGLFFSFENNAIRLMADTEQGASKDFERPGGWDPAERLKDMAIDGISAAVLYPTSGLFIFGTQDGALQRECFRVYNDWLAEFASYAPDRLKGLGLVSLYDI